MTSPFGQPRPVRAPAGSAEFLAILAAAVPPVPGHDHTRPMCAAWDDHRWSSHAIRLTPAAASGAQGSTVIDRPWEPW